MQKIVRTSTVPLSLDLFCRGLLRELSQEYEVVAVSSPGPALEALSVREGVRVAAVPMRRRISPLSDMVSLWRLTRLLRRERPQMVHSITPKAGLLSMIAARIAGVPVRVHTFTGLLFPTASGLRRRLLMLADRTICRFATHVTTEGEGVRDDLLAAGVTDGGITVLGNVRGVDLAYYSRAAVEDDAVGALRAAEGVFTFIFVGRLVRDKGIGELAEAFARLQAGNANVRLLIVGGREDEYPLAAATERILSQSEGICMAGWQEDVRPWYAAADALVLPSYREGFPNAVIEAGAMGLPSIVTDINGSREIVTDGVNGTVVPARDADALYEAMCRMCASPARAAVMGAAARSMAAARYEQSLVRTRLKQFYKEVLG